jgi:hypothetical protein
MFNAFTCISVKAFLVYVMVREVAGIPIPSLECTAEACDAETLRYPDTDQACAISSQLLQSDLMLFLLIEPFRMNYALRVALLVEFGKNEIGRSGRPQTRFLPSCPST